MKKKRKRHYKFMEEGHAACTCCRIEYWQSGVLGGLTIVLKKKDYEECGQSIDIPYNELKHLKKVIRTIEKENKNGTV